MTGKRALYRRKPCTETPCSVLYLVGIYSDVTIIHHSAKEELLYSIHKVRFLMLKKAEFTIYTGMYI